MTNSRESGVGGDYAEPESIGLSTHSTHFFLPSENLGLVLPDPPVFQGKSETLFFKKYINYIKRSGNCIQKFKLGAKHFVGQT